MRLQGATLIKPNVPISGIRLSDWLHRKAHTFIAHRRLWASWEEKMKWTLIVIALGTTPVETGLIYENLDFCYRAEDAMRDEYVRWFNSWLNWAQKNPKESAYPESLDFMKKRVVTGICVPHASGPNSN